MGTAGVIVRWRCAQYDGIVAKAACAHFECGRGVISMVAVLLIAGIGLLLAGLVAIGFGIPVKEFSFGNTLILAGTIAACTGDPRARPWGGRPGTEEYCAGSLAPVRSHPASSRRRAALGDQAPQDGGFLFSRDQPAAE